MNLTELMTADEVAERLQVRPVTVRQWARRGWIPVVRLSPKVVRYDLEAVVKAMTKRQGAKGGDDEG